MNKTELSPLLGPEMKTGSHHLFPDHIHAYSNLIAHTFPILTYYFNPPAYLHKSYTQHLIFTLYSTVSPPIKYSTYSKISTQLPICKLFFNSAVLTLI